MHRRTRPWPSHPLPFHPLLLAAYPVLFLFATNLGEANIDAVVPPLGQAVIVGAALTAFAALAFRDLRRGALMGSALLVAWFAYGHVADLLASTTVGRDVQLAAWLVFLVVALLCAVFLTERWIRRVTSALNVLAVVLVSMSLIQIVPYEVSRSAAAAADPPAVAATPVSGARDIYFIVPDECGSNLAFEALASVHNDLPDWLASQGFFVAPNSKANYIRTTLSFGATLGMRSLGALALQEGRTSRNLQPVYDLIQDNAAAAFLKARGYRYIHVGSWFYPTQSIRIADQNLFLGTTSDFGAILDDTTFGPTLNELIGSPVIPQTDAIHRDNALYQFEALSNLARQPGPKFVTADILLPHPPYVFNVDGSYPTMQEQASRTEAQKIEQQLGFANAQLRRLVTQLLSVPADRQPIIVIAADEGPYPDAYAADENNFNWSTATPDQLETKFGILYAMYLPGAAPAGAPAPYPTLSPWNTFPLLFDRYFGADIPLMPDLSYSSASYGRPYDLTDITARLQGRQGTSQKGQ